MAQQLKFPLKIGIVSYPVTYGDQPPPQIARYELRPDRKYEVVLFTGTFEETVGPCEVVQMAEGLFEVTPEFAINFPTDDCTFWGAFAVDEDGVATLDRVYLVVQGA